MSELNGFKSSINLDFLEIENSENMFNREKAVEINVAVIEETSEARSISDEHTSNASHLMAEFRGFVVWSMSLVRTLVPARAA